MLIRCGDLHVLCLVRDVKLSYGRNRLLVTPSAGTGAARVELERVIPGSAVNSNVPNRNVEVQLRDVHPAERVDRRVIHDINGNAVGCWTYRPPRSESERQPRRRS